MAAASENVDFLGVVHWYYVTHGRSVKKVAPPDRPRFFRRSTMDRPATTDLVGTTVLAVVNLAPVRVAGFVSEVLVLGVVDPADGDDVVLVRPDADGDVRGWRLA